MRARDLPRAIAAYRQLLARSPAELSLRLAVQQRLARSLRNGGREDEALELLQQIIDEHPSDRSPIVAAAWHDRCALLQAGHVPRANLPRMDFGARNKPARNQSGSNSSGTVDTPADACAVAFYAGLADGRWALEAPLYQFYADAARGWIAPLASRADVTRLVAQERALAGLTQAAGRALEAWQAAPRGLAGHAMLTDPSPPLVVAWQPAGGGDTVLVALGPRAAERQIWRPIIDRYAQGYRISIVANRAVVAAAREDYPAAGATAAGPEGADSATSTVEDRGVVWRVTARPDPGRGPDRGARLRRAIYLGTLGLMLASVALAGYFAIRTVRKELEVARLKSEFISAVSHEFRSPLSAISHLAELLDTGRVSGEARTREYYGLIRGEAGRLRRLVDNLLDFARIEEGRQAYRFDAVDVAVWLQSTVDEFRSSPASSGRTIHVTLAPALLEVRADADALTRAVMNLLDNAVKYSPSGTAVWIEAQRRAPTGDGAGFRAKPADPGAADGAWVEISVRDEGPGILAEDLQHVFERFYRGRDTESVGGTGLGLALVQRIVVAHGGLVTLRSAPGEGSTFTIALPANA